jgi:hypothetical protein
MLVICPFVNLQDARIIDVGMSVVAMHQEVYDRYNQSSSALAQKQHAVVWLGIV